MAGESDQTPPQRPLLRVVNGDATPEEIAALVAVLSAAGATAPAARRTPEWSAHHRKARQTHSPGPAGWRSSGLPR
ncbi:acyl-CoA carboxylase epsilon subunit [Nocardioides sp. cx-173]|uniref:acyl-CoA carboxylase epsilon subunit n=1 Tax=Nocardioides sp. cx-173 TaxID=2898796 RepID=UPI001E4593C0|nr:acyl-CoA carboxylase epsilon subunit [Nocardioides sp. cx-173]MCD4525294.1 acyl-CoA carboxylase subunit epsilon [Nocardioides sp. cx-173]UGB40907.1 acyl-CoA carboxylase subunit epsilon [Nocardioides sp. cx-173]